MYGYVSQLKIIYTTDKLFQTQVVSLYPVDNFYTNLVEEVKQYRLYPEDRPVCEQGESYWQPWQMSKKLQPTMQRPRLKIRS